MARYLEKLNTFGKLMILIGILMAVPLLVLPFYPDDIRYAWTFLVPSFGSVFLGILVGQIRGKSREKDRAHYFWISNMTVLAAWGYGFLAGAIPFVLAGKLTFVQALFESVSGWTTTGLSVIYVEETEPIFLFHRSFMQFCGGLGFVLMMTIFVQVKESVNLYSAEGHPDKLKPNIRKTARTIFIMYVSFLIGGTILYRIFGVGIFEGINHAMGALSTGGFSTRTDSIGAYQSVAVEWVTILLMIIGTTNFAVLQLITTGKWKQAAKVSEMRFLLAVLCIFVPLMAFSLSYGMYVQLGEGFRLAVFNAVSALSTTGFSTMAYTDWPEAAVGMMILLMLIGGGIGSTAGGLKLTRVYIMLRLTWENVKGRMASGQSVTSPSYEAAQGRVKIDGKLANQTMGFVTIYCLIFVVGSLLLTITANCSLKDAMFDFASSLGTVGLSIGITNPDTNEASLIIEIIGMVLGRLEIFGVLIGICAIGKVIRQKIKRNGVDRKK